MSQSLPLPLPVVDQGTGAPLVLIPGIQSRWEYQRPTVSALASHFRVITFSLPETVPAPAAREEHGEHSPFDPYVDQVEQVLDSRGVGRAVVCGISFGGLIALRFAARHPSRTAALILVSTPGPGWHLNRRHVVYARWPRLLAPAFFAEAPRRLRREILAAIPHRGDRLRFLFTQARTLATAPLSTVGMAERARLMGHVNPAADCARIRAPTLVVPGDPDLDYIVPAGGTADYTQLIAGAQMVTLERTGHLGSVTKPQLFASAVGRFLASSAGDRHAL